MKPLNGASTIFGAILILLSGLSASLSELAEASAPLGVSAETWAIVGAALSAALIIGNAVQRITGNGFRAPNDVYAWLGFGLTVLLALPAVIGELAAVSDPLGVDPQFWVVASGVVGFLTIVVQQLRAAFGDDTGAPAPA